MVKAPATLHAADGVGGASGCSDDGKDEEQSAAVVREIGEVDCCGQAAENEEIAA